MSLGPISTVVELTFNNVRYSLDVLPARANHMDNVVELVLTSAYHMPQKFLLTKPQALNLISQIENIILDTPDNE